MVPAQNGAAWGCIVDQNTLNFNLDPELWPNLDPYPGPCYQFWKNKKNYFWDNCFLQKSTFCQNYKKKMSPQEICSQLSLWIVNLCLKSCTFCLYFILYLQVWIRTHKAPECGSTTLLSARNTGHESWLKKTKLVSFFLHISWCCLFFKVYR